MEKELLLGRLIGLARATDGSEHLITPETTGLIRQCLRAIRLGQNLQGLPEKVTQQKREMIPNCFTCACPCGRTDDYDAADIHRAAEPVRSLKYALLDALTHRSEKAAPDHLYHGLIALGMDEESVIQRVLTEINSTGA